MVILEDIAMITIGVVAWFVIQLLVWFVIIQTKEQASRFMDFTGVIMLAGPAFVLMINCARYLLGMNVDIYDLVIMPLATGFVLAISLVSLAIVKRRKP